MKSASHVLVFDSPMGPLRLEASPEGLVALSWTGRLARATLDPVSAAEVAPARQHLHLGVAWLRAYFKCSIPSTLPPLSLSGTTFQKAVWRALAALPPGTTTTYGEIARTVRRPGASRAVGQAVGANPLPILIPCHRVLAAGGKLGGYSAGLQRKRWLLKHEGLG
jgi:methylated-DNA-[protein]-cysteine S-methyltransferase